MGEIALIIAMTLSAFVLAREIRRARHSSSRRMPIVAMSDVLAACVVMLIVGYLVGAGSLIPKPPQDGFNHGRH